MRRATEIARGVRARRPVAAHELDGAHLGLERVAGAQLDEPQEADSHGGLERHSDAVTLDGYLVSRHGLLRMRLQPDALRCEVGDDDEAPQDPHAGI